MFTHSRAQMIEWGDCDPAGIVFYPRYFEYFNASTDLLMAAALGLALPAIFRRHGITGWPMVDTGARFFVPNGFGTVVRIETTVTELGRSSFKLQHTLWQGDKRSVEATETRVWVGRDPADPERLKGLPIPDEVRALLAG